MDINGKLKKEADEASEINKVGAIKAAITELRRELIEMDQKK